jgi:acetyl esterase/lipase
VPRQDPRFLAVAVRKLWHASALVFLLAAGCGGGGSSGPPPPASDDTDDTPPPTAERYVDVVFDSVTEDPDIQYGSGARSAGSQRLFMDVFRPANDAETERPVIIVVHGGAFVAGSRKDAAIRELAIDAARRGYVAASIDYRFLEQQPANDDEALIAVIEALHDLKAAVRYFREDADGQDRFGTDGQTTFVAGVSAGGVLALFAAALDDGDALTAGVQEFLAASGGLAGNSSANTQFGSDVQGVLSISGALGDLDWIDAVTAPIYAAHEELDPVVPCDSATTLLGGYPVTVSGSCDVVRAAQAAGITAELYLVEGAPTHVGFSVGQLTEIVEAAATLFSGLIPAGQ